MMTVSQPLKAFDRFLANKVADREVFRETHRNTKETVQDHISFFDDADGDDVEEDEEPLPRRDPPSRKSARKKKCYP